jgi:hypothetical protein
MTARGEERIEMPDPVAWAKIPCCICGGESERIEQVGDYHLPLKVVA